MLIAAYYFKLKLYYSNMGLVRVAPTNDQGYVGTFAAGTGVVLIIALLTTIKRGMDCFSLLVLFKQLWNVVCANNKWQMRW